MMLFHGNSDRNVPYHKATLLGTGFYGSAFIIEQLVEIPEASFYFHSANYRDHAIALEPLDKNHDEIKDFLQRCVVAKDKWRKISNVIDDSVEPQPTTFGLQDYLNSNYASE